MSEHDALAQSFEAHRKHLHGVAYRMLGSPSEAEDAVQEGWLRLSRADGPAAENLGGWLTTVVARVCLDMLRARRSRREESIEAHAPESIAHPAAGDAERDAQLADSVGLAMLVMLESLTPPERVAFVLHDMFDVSFDEIAPIVGRTPAAARQLASRARRRVRGGSEEATARMGRDPHRDRHRELVAAFLAASRDGDLAALLAVLDPDVALRADAAAVATGAPTDVHGAEAVASTFLGRARAARPVLVDGVPGLAWAPGGVARVVFVFSFADDRVAGLELVADAERIARMEIELLGE